MEAEVSFPIPNPSCSLAAAVDVPVSCVMPSKETHGSDVEVKIHRRSSITRVEGEGRYACAVVQEGPQRTTRGEAYAPGVAPKNCLAAGQGSFPRPFTGGICGRIVNSDCMRLPEAVEYGYGCGVNARSPANDGISEGGERDVSGASCR